MTSIAATRNSSLSTTDIKNRNEQARKIETAFIRAGKGETVPNLSAYRDQLTRLEKVAGLTHAALYKTGIPATPQLTAVRNAHDDHRQLLSRISSMAKTAGVTSANTRISKPLNQTPASTKPHASAGPIAPANPLAGLSAKDLPSWEGKLRPGETPLHWAVRNRHHQLALVLRASGHPVEIPDSRQLTPIDEAFLQDDRQMIEILLYPDTIMDPKAGAEFWQRVDAIQNKFAEIQKIDPNKVSSTSWAAYAGDIHQLETANDLDTADKKGLTPLHYAILGGDMQAIRYLLGRCNIYATTKENHSYLDYAVIAGNTGLFNLLQQRLLFTICPPQERREYLVASGILEQQLQKRARAKDPLAMGGKDQDYQGVNVNAVWVASTAFNSWWGKSTDWLGWAGTELESGAQGINRYHVGSGQTLNILPSWSRKAFLIYTLGNIATFLLGKISHYLLPTIVQPKWDWLGSYGSDAKANVAKVTRVAGMVWTGLRFCGAVKPVLNRIPVYIDSFRSRPVQVMKKVGWDLFNIMSQGAMSYYSL